MTMKHYLKISLLSYLLVGLVLGCQHTDSLSISNKLTTFIPEEKILVKNDTKKIIENSSGNYLRDAIRMINTDERTVDYYKNLSLINSSISPEETRYTFSGIASSTINDFPANATQEIVVTIGKESEKLYYELSFGSNP